MNACVVTALSALVLLMGQCATVGDSRSERYNASRRLKEILSWPEEEGGVYHQARKSDEFDYRATLAKAAGGDASALSALFVYTETNHLMGEGTETHIEVLGELLVQLGDHEYGSTLKLESPAVIRQVAVLLNQFWGDDGWPRDKYPTTADLCARNTMAEQVEDGDAGGRL